MAVPKATASARLPMRRGLSQVEAAIYISLGASKFEELVKDGRMPRPRVVDGRRIWDIDEVDAAFRALPVEGQESEVINPWHT